MVHLDYCGLHHREQPSVVVGDMSMHAIETLNNCFVAQKTTMNTTTNVFPPAWDMGMAVMLASCVLALFVLIVCLFGCDCRGGPCWVWGKWAALWVYFRACRCSPNYERVVEQRGTELKKIFSVDEEDVKVGGPF